jgi:hypothetical protein
VASVQECLSAIEELKKEKDVLDLSLQSNFQDLETSLKKVALILSEIDRLKKELERLNIEKK